MIDPGQPNARVTVAAGERELDVRRFAHAAMATVFEVFCVHADATYAAQAAQAAFEVLDRLERELSRFVPNSDVARINALSAGDVARVSPSTMECLQIARRMHGATAGAFDIAIGSGLLALDLLADEVEVRAQADGVRLDLGGIGKGYAVDRMAEVLCEWGIDHALVHGGFSSVVALGPPEGHEGWPLTFSAPGPGAGQVLVRLSAREQAISASGTQKTGHIRDPLTGRPATRQAAWVTLAAPASGSAEPASWAAEAARSPGALTEALSTAFMILDVPAIAGLCTWPGIEAWLLPEPEAREAGAPALVHMAGAESTGSRGAGRETGDNRAHDTRQRNHP